MSLVLIVFLFMKDCIFNTAIKGKDSILVGDLLKKILKEGERLQAIEKKKAEEMQEVFIKQ